MAFSAVIITDLTVKSLAQLRADLIASANRLPTVPPLAIEAVIRSIPGEAPRAVFKCRSTQSARIRPGPRDTPRPTSKLQGRTAKPEAQPQRAARGTNPRHVEKKQEPILDAIQSGDQNRSNSG